MGRIGRGRSETIELGTISEKDGLSGFFGMYFRDTSVALGLSGPRRVYPLEMGEYQIDFGTLPPMTASSFTGGSFTLSVIQ